LVTSCGPFQSASLQFHDLQVKIKYSSLPETKHFSKLSPQTGNGALQGKTWTVFQQELQIFS